MSYILEALKRSEQERHQGELTHTTIDTIMMPSKQVRHQWWPYLLIIILAINVIAYLYFQLSDDFDEISEEQISVLESSVSSKEIVYEIEQGNANQQKYETQNLVVNDKEQTLQTPEKPLPDHLLQTPSLTKRYDLSEASPPSREKNSYQAKSKNYTEEGFEIIAPKQSTKAISSEVLMPAKIEKEPQAVEEKKQESAVVQKDVVELPKVESFEDTYHLNDLDLSFQKGVPDIRFNSHIYSANPSDRRVMINDLYLREGQSFSGITIDTIGEFYIVLVKSSQRFKIPVLRDWFTPQ